MDGKRVPPGEVFMEHEKVQKIMTDSPFYLSDDDELHVMYFRRMLELAMVCGRWTGGMALES